MQTAEYDQILDEMVSTLYLVMRSALCDYLTQKTVFIMPFKD